MNILFFYLPAIAPERGGIERVTSVLADYLESQGQQCFYLATLDENADVAHPTRQFFLPNLEKTDTPENLSFYKEFLIEKKIDIVVFQVGHKKFPWAKFEGHPPLICALHLDPCAYETIVHDKAIFKLRKFSPLKKALLVPIWNSLVVPAKIALRRLKKNAVYRWNYAQCDSYIVLSEAYCKTLAAHLSGGDRSRKIASIPNPCSYHPIEENFEKGKILLYVGRLCMNQKRPDLMLEIWSKIESNFPDWELEMLGNGDDADEVKAIVEDRKIPRVHFRGFTAPEPYFKKAPFLCMTSSNEGFGMVLLEASTFGCIPLAFDAFPTAQDILKDEKTGYLIPALDTDAYARKLQTLMRKGGNVSATACKENAKRYSIEAIGTEWLSLFGKLISK